MISGYGLRLEKPALCIDSMELMANDEIHSMLKMIDNFFRQENTIYDACLTITNNEYQTKYGKYGKYNERIEKTINLRYLTKITLYKDRITFHTVDEAITMPVGKDFMWQCEWEKTYYDQSHE